MKRTSFVLFLVFLICSPLLARERRALRGTSSVIGRERLQHPVEE
jgi:hypothetical protein